MPPPYWKRRLIRQFKLTLAATGMVLTVFFLLDSPRSVVRISIATGYAGLALLALSLMLGPLNVLRGKPNPISTDLRRDVGIWGGMLGLIHMVAGLQVHLGGKFWQYFIFPVDRMGIVPLRYDPFGVANYTGLFSTAILLLLLALSNDYSLKRLRARRWKSLHRWNYFGFAAIGVHSVVYQVLEDRTLPFTPILTAVLLIVVVTQLMGLARLRLTRGKKA